MIQSLCNQSTNWFKEDLQYEKKNETVCNRMSYCSSCHRYRCHFRACRLPWYTGQGYACTVAVKRRTGKEIWSESTDFSVWCRGRLYLLGDCFRKFLCPVRRLRQNRWWYGFCCCKTRNCKDPVLCIRENKERYGDTIKVSVTEAKKDYSLRKCGTTKITCSYTNSKGEKKSVVYTVNVVADDDDWFHRSTMDPCLYEIIE